MNVIRHALVALTVCSPAVAADVFVPGDAPTIQGGIDLALSGDRVLVSPGVYTETLVFPADASVEVVAVGGPTVTVIDGSQSGGAPAVVIASEFPELGALRGFTVADADGDAISAQGTGEVSDCIVTGASGDGIAVAFFSRVDAVATVVRGCDGSGLTVADFATAELRRCEISHNAGTGLVGIQSTTVSCIECLVASNGGLDVDVGGASNVALIDCVVRDNVGRETGGASGPADLSGTLFLRNHGSEVAGGYDATVPFLLDVVGASFVDNTSDTGVPGADVAVQASSFGGTVGVRECVFVGNDVRLSASLAGQPGGVAVSDCTFVGADVEFGAAFGEVVSSILRDGALTGAPVTLDVSYSNVEGGAPGLGNIDVDPGFVTDPTTGVVCLGAFSPCIDAGDPTQTDPDGSPRDMGAVPFASACDAGLALRGAQGFPRLSADGSTTAGAPFSVTLERGVRDATSTWVFGIAPDFAPLKGGVLVPTLTELLTGVPLDADGSATLTSTWPPGVPFGAAVWLQVWMSDRATGDLSASNGLALIGG